MKSKYICRLSCIIAFVAIIIMIDRTIPRLSRYYYRHTYKSLNVKNGTEFEERVRNGTYQLIASESWGSKPMSSSKSFAKYLITKLSNQNSIIGYGEYGFLLHYAFLYAEKQNDQELMSLIKDKFDKYWLLNLSIFRNDQTSYGNVAIDLYLWTKEPKYKLVADRFMVHLDSLSHSDGRIVYIAGDVDQHVDAIGLVPPFLLYYSKVFKDAKAELLASRMVEDFVKWGTDPITGIPCQAYDTKNHIKKQHVNWGRGTSWYLLGIHQWDSEDPVIIDRVEILDSTLINMGTRLYPQYLGQNIVPDMSATIPILYYLNHKGHIQLSKDELSDILSPYIDENGVIRYCSPSISRPHEGVSVLMTNLFCQGLLLYLLSEL